MGDVCTDGRFDLIERFKRDLVEATNIETSPEEMAVLDSILFRMWQMGWLDRLEQPPASPWHSMEDNGPPEENGPYFVYAPSYRGGSSSGKERARGVMISKWTGKHWSIEVGYYKRPGCVTHWMPVEPPKEDA